MNARERRRSFLGTAALGVLAGRPGVTADDRPNVLGPRTGFSPQIGTRISMLTWMLGTIPSTVNGLTQAQLDPLVDAKANTIGALLLHLAATETYYRLHTFDGMKWGAWPRATGEKWDAMELGDAGRQVDESWPWGPTNSYCNWLHVCEHMSHNGGQIACMRSRVG